MSEFGFGIVLGAAGLLLAQIALVLILDRMV
jgi:hypothetical protein